MTLRNRRAFLGSLAGWSGVLAFGPEAMAGGRWRGGAGSGADLDALDFGRFEALAARMQEVAPDALQAELITALRAGTPLADLVAAGALANARTFGGEDYIGYHCFMAMMPAFEMAHELPARMAALPVLKVLYRNATRIQSTGGRRDALQRLPAAAPGDAGAGRRELWQGFLARDAEACERAFHAAQHAAPLEALHDVQSILRETVNVHRIVLTWRAWDVLQLTGEEHAETLLRQSIRFCVEAEAERIRSGRGVPELRSLLPELMEEHGLAAAARGTRAASDAELEELAALVFGSERDEAARAVASSLGRGMVHEDVGRALSLAANRLMLVDPGRRNADGEDKPVGSVHGASTGVHASDAARAWRNLATVSRPGDAAADLIAGAYHTAGQSGFVGREPFPFEERREALAGRSPTDLLEGLVRAVAANDQPLAMAHTAQYGGLDADPEPLFAALAATAVEADGALHAEKYFRTVREDCASARPAQRWQHLVALARVSASEAGFVAPGLADAQARLAR